MVARRMKRGGRIDRPAPSLHLALRLNSGAAQPRCRRAAKRKTRAASPSATRLDVRAVCIGVFPVVISVLQGEEVVLAHHRARARHLNREIQILEIGQPFIESDSSRPEWLGIDHHHRCGEWYGRPGKE